MKINIDWNALVGKVTPTVVSGFQGLLGGTAEVATLAIQTTEHLARFALDGNQAGISECAANLRVLGEAERIQANAAAWETAAGIAKAVGGTLLGVVGAMV